VIYNNLKGRIVDVATGPGQIRFDVGLDRPLTEFDATGGDLVWMEGSTVRFSAFDYDSSDEDDDSVNTSVPFQVAYAVSIHSRALGRTPSRSSSLMPTRTTSRTASSTWPSPGRETLKIFRTRSPSRLCSSVFDGPRTRRTLHFCRSVVDSRPLRIAACSVSRRLITTAMPRPAPKHLRPDRLWRALIASWRDRLQQGCYSPVGG